MFKHINQYVIPIAYRVALSAKTPQEQKERLVYLGKKGIVKPQLVQEAIEFMGLKGE